MAIDNEDMEQLKLVFVTRKECDNINDDIEKKLANDNTELALIKQQLKQISWGVKTTLGTVITAIVMYVLSQMLR